MSKTPRFPPKPRIIRFVLFPGFQIVDAAGPIGAFEIAARFAPGAYTLKLAAVKAGLIPSSAGVAMPAEALSGRAKVDTFIIVGGDGTREAIKDAALIRAIKAAPARARRVASVCSGALLLAQAGLLEGKRATTHWRRAPQMAQMFPNVRVEADCIHVKDGAVWTSAGITAGIDLALAMIAEDLGEDVAASVAR
jgi:transcriptional regulator GlxA family with amidase domain